MKIALCGSAPSSMMKAPFGDTSWQIWGCSPGLYPHASRVDAWFEVHRWEPPVIGRAEQQVPWFSPEYVMWLQMLKCPVWMLETQPMVPTSQPLPWQELSRKYGTYFFNSSLSWMAAMAIEAILLNRELKDASDARAIDGPDAIGFWGVDMAADDEVYTQQKAGCQFFATLAASMGIQIHTPPESDLMVPRPMYGVWENSHRHIKLMSREKEFKARKAGYEAQLANAQANLHYINGAMDDLKYHLNTWIHEGEYFGPNFESLPFAKPIQTATPPVTPAAQPAQPPAPVMTAAGEFAKAERRSPRKAPKRRR